MTLRTAVLAGAVTLVGLGGFLLLQMTQVTDEGVKVGQVPVAEAKCKEADCLPPIAVKDVNGTAIDDASLAGKVVMVNFWAPWCGPCLEEMPALEAVARRHAADGFVILGIALDEASDAAAREFAARHGVTYPIVRTNRELERVFGRPAALPTSIIYDRSGHLVKRFSRSVSAAQLEADIAPLLR
jgi:cytochrome c biogenesis protein CcmG, thiol:disulfide interchange protein DsbE